MATKSSLGRPSRIKRWAGLVGVGLRRVREKALVTESRRIALSVSGVAIAIALMLIVTGVAMGLSSQTTVGGDSVDYWITPEAGSTSTMVVSTEGPQFGAVHSTTARLTRNEEVAYATPVLMHAMEMHTPGGEDESEYVVVIGVIAQSDVEVAGLSAGPLTPGDPHYANGSYNGTWTGQAVMSPASAELLNATNGTSLIPSRGTQANRTLTVSAVGDGDVSTGMGQLPIVLVHLSEAQQLSGATAGDQADQILVDTNSRDVKSELENVYPRSTVMARSGLTAQNMSSGLPLAMSVAALCVALIVGTLFVGTTMGLEITADQQQYALLGALGLPWRSRAVVVLVQALTVTVVGGILGLALGYLGIQLTNQLAQQYIAPTAIAVAHPMLAVYGVGVSILIGLLAAPYLLWLTKRTSILEQLTT
ncbi:ABC transporter permease [Halorussus salinisoli]|uniref:ABC transporter permease n=1 Tax=Halorussus salinisoli TaxID=2558242 RepID=UPI00148520D9|nr:ABC transporter permease [Halorussus salinisoli]